MMGLGTDIRVRLLGDDHSLDAAFKRTQEGAKKTGKALKDAGSSSGSDMFGKIAKGVGLGAVAAVGVAAAAVVDLTNTALKYNDALETLQVTMKNAGLSYKANAAEIQAVIDANIKYGTKEDDTLALLNQGVVATGSLSKATALLTEAQNIHFGSTMDLNTAYMAALKGSEGNIKALRAMGIDLPIVASSAEKVKVAFENVAKAEDKLKAVRDSVAQTTDAKALANADRLFKAKQALMFLEQQDAHSKTHTLAQEQALVKAQEAVKAAELAAGSAGTAGLAKIQAAQDAVTAATKKYNDLAQSGSTVTAALNSKFAGQAHTHAQDVNTQIAAMQAQYDKLKRELGEKLLPIENDVMKAITDPTNVYAAEKVLTDFANGFIDVANAAIRVWDILERVKHLGGSGGQISLIHHIGDPSTPGVAPAASPQADALRLIAHDKAVGITPSPQTYATAHNADAPLGATLTPEQRQHNANVELWLATIAAHLKHAGGPINPTKVISSSARGAKQNGRPTPNAKFTSVG